MSYLQEDMQTYMSDWYPCWWLLDISKVNSGYEI